MNSSEANEYTNRRYKEVVGETSQTPQHKINVVNQIIQELRQYHNFAVTMLNAPIKGVTLDNQEVVYHVG